MNKVERIENTFLEAKADDTENRGRRNNYIIYGLKEGPGENSSTIGNIVRYQALKDNLDVMVSAVERIHRLGKPTSGKMRPAIFKLSYFNGNLKILKDCYSLQATTVCRPMTIFRGEFKLQEGTCSNAQNKTKVKVTSFL